MYIINGCTWIASLTVELHLYLHIIPYFKFLEIRSEFITHLMLLYLYLWILINKLGKYKKKIWKKFCYLVDFQLFQEVSVTSVFLSLNIQPIYIGLKQKLLTLEVCIILLTKKSNICLFNLLIKIVSCMVCRCLAS